MIPREILKKIRQIELRTNRIVTETLAGQYHSVFKGQGMNFDEVREYQPGDDVRAIDWNVTARMNHPFIKKFVEERELTLMLVVDVSGSGLFGSRGQSKRELAAEIASVLAFSAIRNNDKVGLILFSDEVEKFIPPRKGRSHVLRVIREVLYFQPQRRGTDLVNALEFMARVTAHRAIDEAGLTKNDIDGLFCAGWLTMESIMVAEYLGINPVYSDSTMPGGAAFEFHVDRHRPRDGAHRAGARAELAHGGDRGFLQLGMVGQAEVVVAGQVDHLLAVVVANRRLLVVEDAQFEVGSLGAQFVERGGQVGKLGAGRGLAHGVLLKQSSNY